MNDNTKMKQNTITRTRTDETAREIDSIMQGHFTALSGINDRENDELAACEKMRDEKLSRLGEMTAESRSMLEKIKTLTDGYVKMAERHLESQKMHPPTGGLSSGTVNPKGDQLKIAQDCADAAYRKFEVMKKVTKPSYVLGLIAAFAAIGFVFAVAVGIKNGSFDLFVLTEVIFVAAGGAISIALYLSAQSSLERMYLEILAQKEIADGCLKRHERIVSENDNKNRLNIRGEYESEEALITGRYAEERWNLIDEVEKPVKQYEEICESTRGLTSYAGSPWNENWETWQPYSLETENESISPSVSFGRIETKDSITSNDGDEHFFSMPALMGLSSGKGLLFKTTGAHKAAAINTVQAMMLRLLAVMPPGMLRFTMLDPIGLGQNVAAFMPLGKYDDKLITSRAWSEPGHIDDELEKLTLHLQDVIQMRLRNEHKNIEEYNNKSKVKEPYRVVVAMDFPTNFGSDAIRRLISIAENGPRCGVYPIIMVDMDMLAKNTPYNFDLQNLARHLDVIDCTGEAFFWDREEMADWDLELDSFDLKENKQLLDMVIERIGEKAVSEMKVEVPFEELLGTMAPTPENLWADGASTAETISAPLGPHNVEQLQELVFDGTSQHAIIIGKTGSGKTNLMDVIITMLALKYSPAEMEFYLIDLKKGVGFKPYANAMLPHAEVIAIDSEREFALSVLRGLIEKMEKRGKTFNEVSTGYEGAMDGIKMYRQKTGKTMSRILLVVDEFQNLFLEDDHLSRDATLILERLAREGRSFGIHIILGSQSLAGKAAHLSSATLGQIGIRIALMCNESDARAIMADDNPEARLLALPGEAIYNNQNGLIEGNKRFQAALFKDSVRQKYLGMIAERAKADNLRKPIVFEGNELAKLDECEALIKTINGELGVNGKKPEVWLGEPIKLSDKPTAVAFRRQSGSNLLAVARDEEEGVGMMISAWLSLALQKTPGEADFFSLNLTNSEERWFERVQELSQIVPHNVTIMTRKNLGEKFGQLAAEIDVREKADASGDSGAKADGKSIFVFIFGLQRAKDLRPDEGGYYPRNHDEPAAPEPSELFTRILKDGPEVGVHVLTWCDLASNVRRTLDRKVINEFNFRIATQMSDEDSRFILDSADAAKLDRPHRAIFYDEDHPGYLEKFRPFAIPADQLWWEKIAAEIRNFHNSSFKEFHG